MAGKATKEGFQIVDRLDACAEADRCNRLLQLACRQFHLVAIVIHEDHDGRIITLSHEAAVDLCHGLIGVLDHREGVLIDLAAVGLENLIEEATDLCRHFLRNFSRCFTASCVSMKMNRVDQRYSVGSSDSAERTPGVLSSGNPSIETV